MKTQSLNILGYTGSNSRFIVKTQNTGVQINRIVVEEAPEPYEFILAGVAGYLDAIGRQVAAEQGLVLKSLQVEISATLNLPQPDKLAFEKPYFDKIIISLKPSTPASIIALQQWHSEVKRRTPMFENLVNSAPADTLLFRDYSLN